MSSRWFDLGQVLFCVFIDRVQVEASKNAKKTQKTNKQNKTKQKKPGQYTAILIEQAWSIKDLLYGQRGTFFCGTNPGNPEWPILPARVT